MRTSRIILTMGFIAFFAFNSIGQTEKGKFILGVGNDLGFSSGASKWKSDNGSGKNGNSFSFSLDPNAGYFVDNGLVFGLGFGIGYTSYKSEDGYKTSVSSFTLGPYVRYYFGKGDIRPFLNAEYGYGSTLSKSKDNYGETKSSYQNNSYSLGGGFACFLNDRISLDMTVGYHRSVLSDNDNTENMKYISFDLTAGISFNYVFF